MRHTSFYDLPDWDDEDFHDDESWKPNPTREACKALYQQWQHVFFLINTALSQLINAEDITIADNPRAMMKAAVNEEIASDILDEAMMTAARIITSETSNIYVSRMENAAIIRKCVLTIYSSLFIFLKNDAIEKEYISIIRGEMDTFRNMFKEWVGSFEKDAFKDEWGLFI